MDKKIIDRLFPNPLPSSEEIERRYPLRKLPEGARVMRFAPSPTGFLHIGGVFSALVTERSAHSKDGGVFILRIEDTDQEREVEGAVELITGTLKDYEIKADEGVLAPGEEKGAYGPYTQSKRAHIYQAYVKHLVERRDAYPCFCTKEEIEEIGHQQEASGVVRRGYYGQWAKCRHLSKEQIEKNLDEGKPFAIRYKSNGDPNKTIVVNDFLRGNIQFPEYLLDIPIMKANDGLPTYHFALVIDDHLMGTTHITRADEWLPSYPLHIQLFRTMGWKPPKFGHLPPLQKLDDGNRRKLSKRKDPEATMSFYDEQGYPRHAVIEYLLNIANSNFEDWRRNNPDKGYNEFPFDIKRINNSGALFDFVKLNNISREIIAKMNASELYDSGLAWAERHNPGFASLMKREKNKVLEILDIERSNTPKPRKDIVLFSDLQKEVTYFFSDSFSLSKEEALSMLEGIDDIKSILTDFMASYDDHQDRDAWFANLQEIGAKYGYARNGKERKENPNAYKGDISSVAKIFRVLLTGRPQSADLHSIMRVMGKDMVLSRLQLLS